MTWPGQSADRDEFSCAAQPAALHAAADPRHRLPPRLSTFAAVPAILEIQNSVVVVSVIGPQVRGPHAPTEESAYEDDKQALDWTSA